MRHNNFYGPLFERHAFLPKKRFMKDDSYDQLILSEVRLLVPTYEVNSPRKWVRAESHVTQLARAVAHLDYRIRNLFKHFRS